MWFSTIGFTVFFAVWVMFAIVGIPIRKEFNLTETQFAWLVSIPILIGSLLRLTFGIITDRYGGRVVFTLLALATAIPCYFVSQAHSYIELLIYAMFAGLAGNSFAIGIAWVSAWFPKEQQGFSLGVFGAGNVGASITKIFAPILVTLIPAAGIALVPGGWRFVPFIYSILLVLMGIVIWFFTPKHDKKPAHGRHLSEIMEPLKHIRVWRFGLYYIVVFGAYVALSLWLPKYYVDVYKFDLKVAGLLTALFIFPASLLRPLGGYFSDKIGARRVMYWVFGAMALATLVLSIPNGHVVLYVSEKFNPDGLRQLPSFVVGPWLFTALIFIVGVSMGIGKAAVYKYIPDYFPNDVGAVGGLVGLLGALGGFFLPPMFAYVYEWTALPQTTFFILFLFTICSLIWLHITIMGILGQATPALKEEFEFHNGEQLSNK